MGSLRVGHDWVTSLSLFTFIHWRRKWQPTPVFLPGESQGRGSLVGFHLWGRTESDTTEATEQQQQQHGSFSPSFERNLHTVLHNDYVAAAAKSLQSCPTLCNPIDGSPPGSPIPGILQARVLEWGAISFSNEWKWKVKVKPLSRVRLLATPWTAAYQAILSMGFSRQEYWNGVPLPSPLGLSMLLQMELFYSF